MRKPFVSIIIPTKDEENYIGNCLKSLKNQLYQEKEIILVDSSFNNKTKEIVEKIGVDKYIRENCTISIARNRGAKNCDKNSKYLVHLDADTRLDKDWLERGISYLETHPGVVAIYADFKPLEDLSFGSALVYCLAKLENKLLKVIGKGNIAMLATGMIVRRKDFEEIGGYSNNFVACEDIDLTTKLLKRGKVKFLKEMKGYASLRGFKKFGILRRFLYWHKNFIEYLFGKTSREYIR